MKPVTSGRVSRWGWSMLGLLAVGYATPLLAGNCDVAAEQGGLTVPVDRLDPTSRCLVGTVIERSSASGVIGPVRTPIAQDFYTFLLDRPVTMATLVQRLGIGPYQCSVQGPNRFWVNDGDGTQGSLALVYQDRRTRIYYLEGYHEGHIFPMVRAKAVVFLRMTPVASEKEPPGVETQLVSYVQLADPILAALVSILRPLVGEAVTRKLTRGFEVITQLGEVIAREPERVVELLPSLPLAEPEDQQALLTLLRTGTSSGPALAPARSTP